MRAPNYRWDRGISTVKAENCGHQIRKNLACVGLTLLSLVRMQCARFHRAVAVNSSLLFQVNPLIMGAAVTFARSQTPQLLRSQLAYVIVEALQVEPFLWTPKQL